MTATEGVNTLTPPGSSSSRWRSLAIIWTIAILVMLPELVAGPSYSFSFRYNFIWAGEFSRLFLAGDPWPRWLPALWDGLGSPTFYFYAPLYFWVVSILRAVSFTMLPVTAATSVATLIILAISGVGMRAWLRGFASEKAALVGAIGYMLAPYHLDDIYTRGALAEVAAYALLPLIMVALRRLAAAGKTADMAALGLVYALLILCHLPIALLASVTLLPLAMFWQAWRDSNFSFLLRCAFAIALGIGLAAWYWFPALALRPYTSWNAMGGDFFRIDRWFFWSKTVWQVSFQAFLTLAASLFAVAALIKSRSADVLLWVFLILFSALLISGALPFFWRLPGLREVQFAWRLLVVVEFAVITLLVMARPRLMHPLTVGGITATFVAVGFMFAMVTARIEFGWRVGDTARAVALSNMAEAPEYLPAGYPIAYDQWGRADPGQFVAPPVPLARAAGASSISAIADDDGGVTVLVRSASSVRVIVRRFAFPGWVVSDGSTRIETSPHGRDRLVSWIAPPGAHEFRLYRERPAPERVGLLISVSSAALLLMLWLHGLLKTSLPLRVKAAQ